MIININIFSLVKKNCQHQTKFKKQVKLVNFLKKTRDNVRKGKRLLK